MHVNGHRRRRVAEGLLLFLALALPSLAAEDTPWSVTVGPVYRDGMNLRITGSSHAQAAGLLRPGNARRTDNSGGTTPGSSIVPTGYADRTYDDGFVFMDAATIQNGETWYWGYQDPSQYDPQNHTLTFHSDQSAQQTVTGYELLREVTLDCSVNVDEDLDAAGVQVGATRNVWRGDTVSVAIDCGIAAYPSVNYRGSASTLAGTETTRRWQSSQTVTATTAARYDLPVDDFTGEYVVPDDAPYEGTYDGPGTVIPNTPADVSSAETVSAGPTRTSTSVNSYRNQISFDLDASIYQLWLGPRVTCKALSPLRFSLVPAATLNCVLLDGSRTEDWIRESAGGMRQTVSTWSDSSDQADWLLGASIQADVAYDLTETWFVQVAGAYEWVPREVEVDLGPNTVELDISACRLAALVGRRF